MKLAFLTSVVLAFLILAPSVTPSRLIKHSPHLRYRHKHNHDSLHGHHHTRSLDRDAYDYNDLAKNARSRISRGIRKELTGIKKQGKLSTIQVAGSRLPDCTNACGPCKPCKLVIVSFVCASLSEAESCPMAYKCMCRNKSYPVP